MAGRDRETIVLQLIVLARLGQVVSARCPNAPIVVLGNLLNRSLFQETFLFELV